MRYFPVNLDLRGRLVVIVGGGTVALRKACQLYQAGARIRIIAPGMDPEMERMVADGMLAGELRSYLKGDLDGAALVVAATDEPNVNIQVADDAKKLGIPVNVADPPETGSCTFPAIAVAGDIVVTVSTGGSCPAFSRWLAKKLGGELGSEYPLVLELVAAVREKLLTDPGRRAYNSQILAELLESDLPGLVREERLAEINALLMKIAGADYTIERLPLRTVPPWRLPTS